MKKQQVEISSNKLETFISKRTLAVVSIVSITISVVMFLLGPSMTNKTALLLQEERISAQRKTIDELTKVQQNDTQEVKASVKELKDTLEEVEIQVSQLTTIINERIPAKK